MLALIALLLTADPKACAKDADCTPQPSACVAKKCTEVAPKPVKHWVLWREGKQCQLRAKKEVEKEKQRLALAVAEVWATYSLDPTQVPAACVPKKRFGPEPVQVCQACGCPETWYFCAASADDLKKFGYSPVE